MDFNKIFNQECDENYWNMVNFVSSYLMKTNEKYKDSVYKCSDIIEKYPKLKKVLEDEVSVGLSKKEVKVLLEYLSSMSDRNILKNKQLICTTCRNTYFFLKKIGLLKEKNNDD